MLRVSVISPELVLFEGEARSVVAPAYDGEVGILTQHAPMMTLLGRGVLRLEGGTAGEQRFRIDSGFLQVADDEVRVVTERAALSRLPGAEGRGRCVGLGRDAGATGPGGARLRNAVPVNRVPNVPSPASAVGGSVPPPE